MLSQTVRIKERVQGTMYQVCIHGSTELTSVLRPQVNIL